MADILPMFPLSLIAFPEEEVNLHIFEPRYKQLIYECYQDKKTFCILPYFENKPLEFATEMELIDIAKTYEDGKMDIHTKAKGVVKVLEFFPQHPNKLYPGAEIEKVIWDTNPATELAMEIIPLLHQLYKTMNITNVPVKNAKEFRSYQNIHKIGLSTEDELFLLSTTEEKDRLLYILNHLKGFVPMMLEAEELKRKAELNGHFKNLKPGI